MSNVDRIEDSIRLEKAHFSKDGALIVNTGEFTGRAATKRFVVRSPEVENEIAWGNMNQPIDPEIARTVVSGVQAKLEKEKTYSFDGFVGGLPIRVTSTSPWHILFAENMFRDKPVQTLVEAFRGKKVSVLHDPYGKLTDYVDFNKGEETLIVLDPVELRVCIVGTAYAGEIKKSAFAICNYLLPEKGILPMHSSANCNPDGTNSCVLFGLSGTGKTTLSADPQRALIGDDEIVWSSTGLSNLEGGCYAKLIDLKEENEPEIWKACNRFGSILENVGYNPETREVDFSDGSRTENTRGSYDIHALSNVFNQDRESDKPKTIVFLTADAFGALPAVARLDAFQAQYHFISGYTAKVAGTELGVTEPQAAFSACFGAPFMPRPASVYASLLAKFAQEQGASVWLLNTGWTNGGYGKGQRFPISVSRRLLAAIQSGELNNQPMEKHPVFGFDVPKSCPGIEPEHLSVPQGEQVLDLARRFIANMEKHSKHVDAAIVEKGGPLLGKSSSGAHASPSRVSL